VKNEKKRKRESCLSALCTHSYTTIIYPSFMTRRMVCGVDPYYLKFWVKLTQLERKRRFSTVIRS